MGAIRWVIIMILLHLGCDVVGQKVVLRQVVEEDTLESDFGPNEKLYVHGFFYLGFMVGEPDDVGAETKLGTSYDWGLGVRAKLKVSNFYALVFDGRIANQVYHLAQDSAKKLPNFILHDREVLTVWDFQLSWANRFNVGKRGNSIGDYIDLGVYGEVFFSKQHKTFNDISANNLNNARREKAVYSGLRYFEPINYGAEVRLGSNQFVLYGRYRLSDMFRDKFDLPEMTRWIVGMEIGFF